MKVSLVATVKDAAPHVGEFLASIEAQTRAPDELIVVDGGSTDGTLEILRSSPSVTLIEEPGSNISRGRNVAVRAASHDVIAVSDADCVLAPEWLERILEPIARGADVSMGLYRPLASSLFEICAAAVSIKDRDEVRPDRYLPSSRSVAFRREAFEIAGRYPEWLDIGEDMYLNLRWRSGGARMELADGAVVFRRPRPGLRAYWRQFAAYAEGDARAGMHARRHAIRFAAYGTLAFALGSRRRGALALVVLGGAAYAARPARRVARRVPPGRRRILAMAGVPALMAVNDVAKMTGYLRGLAARRQGGAQ